jgi:hypothetical protein
MCVYVCVYSSLSSMAARRALRTSWSLTCVFECVCVCAICLRIYVYMYIYIYIFVTVLHGCEEGIAHIVVAYLCFFMYIYVQVCV